ncbi:MAG: hypothetical protein HZB37_05955 [Planctomycetes bacterium]|nr:hypothetical protein [Planctomycetota bacterium]
MEMLLAHARVYLLVIVFFATCFLGFMSEVSLPMLAIRSVVITGIVGIVSSLFVKYIVSVINTVPLPSEEQTAINKPVPPAAGGIKTGKKT